VDDAPLQRRDRGRAELVDVAAHLLASGGPDALTTRAVAAAAGVQAPTLYRLFGDKDGLLDAVAEHVFTSYVSAKAAGVPTGPVTDALAELRAGWDTHIGFGLANPALMSLLSEPGRGRRSPAVARGIEVLRARVHRVAVAGRLRVPEQRAVDLVHSIGTGVVLTLLAQPADARDLGLADAGWDAVVAAIATDPPTAPVAGPAAPAIALRAGVDDLAVLTERERGLLVEWLDRVIAG
jgi:AcrR family transcriptional regulator